MLLPVRSGIGGLYFGIDVDDIRMLLLNIDVDDIRMLLLIRSIDGGSLEVSDAAELHTVLLAVPSDGEHNYNGRRYRNDDGEKSLLAVPRRCRCRRRRRREPSVSDGVPTFWRQ